MNNNQSGLDIVLVHHPVVNKIGETIGSAVTNLDIHDIARTGKTYGVDSYYIVTPYKDQHKLVYEILHHWKSGHGATYNPARGEALELVQLEFSLEDVIETIRRKRGCKPLLITTSARTQEKSLGYSQLRARIEHKEPILLLFGTAHGLAPEIMEMTDYCLPPVGAGTGYNHLSVRSAVSIILDRLLGVPEDAITES